MKSNKEIKTRIKSIEETSKITKAMHMVSIAKSRRAMRAFDGNKVYFDVLKKAIAQIFAHEEEIVNPYVGESRGGKVAFIVIASDKGLAGSFNHKVLNHAFEEMKSLDDRYIFAIGQKTYDFFTARGFDTNTEYIDIMHNPQLEDARRIMYDVLELYDNKAIDEVRLIYTYVDKGSLHVPVTQKLLPIDERSIIQEGEIEDDNKSYELKYYNEVIDTVVKQYLLGSIYSALIQSLVAEHFERMVAMDNATTNSMKMLAKLNLYYNKLRQEKITTEISETSVFLLNRD